MPSETVEGLLSIGQVAEAIGCQTWRLRRLFERGLLPEPPRVGPYRLFGPGDVPRIRAAALAAGYLRSPLGQAAVA